MNTPFDLIQALRSWFFAKDGDIHTGGKDINTGGGDVIVGAGSVDGVDLTAHVANADAHHNESHAHTHASTTGQTANDHHNESHALASHTGSLSHDTDLADVSANDHHNESHNVASHSDTSATGSELNTLTDGSDASALHDHDGRYFQESEFSSNPGSNSTPLESNSGGGLTLVDLHTTNEVRVNDGLTVGSTSTGAPKAVIYLVEKSTTVGTPPSGFGALYMKNDSRLYYKNDAGTEYGPL